LINLLLFIYTIMLMWNEFKGQSWSTITPIKTGRSNEKGNENENQARPQ
jgi:hypothetical protein